MAFNIPTYLNTAKFALISYADREAKELAFKGSYTTPQYSRILSVIIQAIQARYNKLPNDPTLQATGEYMYALSGGANTTVGNLVSPLIITLQPKSQTVTVGTLVSFSVAATNGTPPYSYQWVFNGTPIGGATSSSFIINPTVLGSAGSYDCIVTDSVGTTVTSAIANLVVNAAALTGSFYYGSTDYFTALSGGTDAISYQGTFPITHNSPLSIAYPTAADNNMFLVIRVPIGESVKTTWFNNSLNNGFLPDAAFQAPLQPVGLPLYTYYCTRIAISNDFSQPLILS